MSSEKREEKEKKREKGKNYSYRFGADRFDENNWNEIAK